jgi:hypothetical protein
MLFDTINRPLRNEPVFTSLDHVSERTKEVLLPLARLQSLAASLTQSRPDKQVKLADFLVPKVFDVVQDRGEAQHYCFPIDEQNYFLAQWVSEHDTITSTVRSVELLNQKQGREFLKNILTACLSSQLLYDAAYSPGNEVQDGSAHLMCSVTEYEGQLFCTYRFAE